MMVVGPDQQGPNFNRSFYRVAAIDANGIASGPSALIELPHPFIYSQPEQTAAVGTPYRYQPKTLNCLGDLQYRYTEPGYDFWEEEGYKFEVTEGPAWLEIDAESGELSGTPSEQDVGLHTITIICRRTYPREVKVKADDERNKYFLKEDERFQAEHQQTFELSVK